MAALIRDVLETEIACLQDIEREAASRFRSVGMDGIADGEPNATAFILSVMNKGEVLGAESNGELVGFVMAGQLDDAMHLYEISVSPAFGGRGIGSRLLEGLEARARSKRVAALSLSTFADIPWNAPFYARRGFTAVNDADWSPAFHILRRVEREAGLPTEKRVFMRKELG